MLLLLCRHQRSACETNWIGCDEKSGFKIGSENDGSTFEGRGGESRNENVLRTSSPSLPSPFSLLIFMKDWASGRARTQAGGTSSSVGRSANKLFVGAGAGPKLAAICIISRNCIQHRKTNEEVFFPMTDGGGRAVGRLYNPHASSLRGAFLPSGDWRGVKKRTRAGSGCRIYASSKGRGPNDESDAE